IWGRWTQYRRAQRARMDEFRARDLGFDERASEAAYGWHGASRDEQNGQTERAAQNRQAGQPEPGLLAGALPLDTTGADAGRGDEPPSPAGPDIPAATGSGKRGKGQR